MSERSSGLAGTDMKRRQILTTAGAALLAVAPAPARAQRGDDDGDQYRDNDMIGSWFALVTVTNPPLGQFNALTTFHDDGTVVDSRRYLAKPTPFGDLLETTGHGAWSRTGHRTFAAFLLVFVQSVDTGLLIGTDNVRLSLTLGRDGASLSGTFVTQLIDTAGNLIVQLAGDYSASRITV